MLFILLFISLYLFVSSQPLLASSHAKTFCNVNYSYCTQQMKSSLMTLAARDQKQRFKKRKSSGTTFVFDPRRLSWHAYRNGRLIKSGRASGGKSYCADVRRSCLTPRGHFRVYSKGSPYCRSSKFPLGRGGAPMPYCMFFRGGYAIHGSPDVPNYNASHGCIRVLPSAARWLSKHFMRIGTKVIVRPY